LCPSGKIRDVSTQSRSAFQFQQIPLKKLILLHIFNKTLKKPAENRDSKQSPWGGKLGFRRKAAQEVNAPNPAITGGTGKKNPD